jgi:hypothetical protein
VQVRTCGGGMDITRASATRLREEKAKRNKADTDLCDTRAGQFLPIACALIVSTEA